MAHREITLQIDEEVFRFLNDCAGFFGYLDARDYLQGIANTAILEEMDLCGALKPKGQRSKDTGATEFDDDIPF